MNTLNSPARRGIISRQGSICSLILLVWLISCILPVGAMPVPFGEPAYTATITGGNELFPGNITPLTIEVRNTAQTPEKVLDPDDPVASSPVIGYGAELTLRPGNAPVSIPATSLTIPALPENSGVPVTFPVIVPADAIAGDYFLNLDISSQYARSVTMEGMSNTFRFLPWNMTLTIPVTITETVRIRVDAISSSNLSSGENGLISATITNIGQYAGRNASVELIPDKGSPLSLFQGSVFLGTFAPGVQRTVEWRGSVAGALDQTTVPATIQVSYEDKHHLTTDSIPVTVGIPVQSGPKFELDFGKPEIEPGGSVTVNVRYTNTGDSPATDASAKIVPLPPLSSPETVRSLGTIEPGGFVDVAYDLNLEGSALVKRYGVLTDVRYRGGDGLVAISDPMYIELEGRPAGIETLIFSPLSLVILLGILLIAGYLFLKREGRLN